MIRRLRPVVGALYTSTLRLTPLNELLARRDVKHPNSVLHISYLVHILVHYRGCEIRDLNMRPHPLVNICQDCTCNPRHCFNLIRLRTRSGVSTQMTIVGQKVF